MKFRNLFLVILLGIVASLWVAAPASAEYTDVAVCLADAGQAADEAGAKSPGEAEDLGHWALPPRLESFRTAARLLHVDSMRCDPALPAPLRPPSHA